MPARNIFVVLAFCVFTACPEQPKTVSEPQKSAPTSLCQADAVLDTASCEDNSPEVVIAELTTVCNSQGDGIVVGECIIHQCAANYELADNQCTADTCEPGHEYPPVDCTDEVAFSVAATKSQTCAADGIGYDFGPCIITQCEDNYGLADNVCIELLCHPDQTLEPVNCAQEVPHSAVATKTTTCNSDGTGLIYGPCIVTQCAPDFELVGDACFSADEILIATATPSTITEDETTTLAWQTTDAVAEVLNDGVSVGLQGSVQASPQVTSTYHFKALDSNQVIIARVDVLVTVTPLPPPVLPPPPTGERRFVTGAVPEDGFKESTTGFKFKPDVKAGVRLSGTVTIELKSENQAPDIPFRLLVDGVPQPSQTIDTNDWADGTHVVAFQVIDAQGHDVANSGQVVVFNNSGAPLTSLQDQAVLTGSWSSGPMSIAWGRVNVIGPSAYPLDPQLDKHPPATTDAQRQRLATEKLWWVEGVNHQGTPLFQTMPVLMKNLHGDYFVKQFNPESRNGLAPSSAFIYVDSAPAYDGPRGIGWVSPYTTFTAAPHILHSGESGWLGVDLSGRVVRVDITGEVTTVLGPRSVAGVVGTDNDEVGVDLAARLANGEKEYIGDHGGLPLKHAQDIWTCNSFPFEGVIADTGNNRIVEIHFEKRKLMRSWPIPEVTSVWASLETQEEGNAWFATNPNGLWRQRIVMDPVTHQPTGHGVVEQVADIPNAFWVRGDQMRIYVLTLDLGIYEYDLATGTVFERRAREPNAESFAFLAVDENGSIGPRGRLYIGSTGTSNASAYKTAVYWHDPDDWSTGRGIGGSVINRVVYGNWTAGNFGHYMWGFAPHSTLPKFISNGVTGSSWFLWTASLGELPVPDQRLPADGVMEWRRGKRDAYPALSTIFGFNGHGDIGYSCDEFRQYKTYDEARGPMRSVLDPLFPPGMPETDRENVTKQLFVQRTRKHFQ